MGTQPPGEPRFPGHQQPKVPPRGYEGEADSKVFAKMVDAAADHGVGVYLFDWLALAEACHRTD